MSVRRRQAMVGVRDHHFALLQHFVLKAHKRGDIVVIGLLQQLVRLFSNTWLSVRLPCRRKIRLNKTGFSASRK